MVHLGHGGDPCPSGGLDGEDIVGDVEDEWEDIEDQPRPHHLSGGTDRSCLTVVHTSGVHFCDVRYCNCPDAGASHLQLVKAGLYPATTKEPRTVFTFQVLDDFIMDNVECGTSAMNYYSKLRRVTSNAFPGLVPVSSKHDIKDPMTPPTLIQEQIQRATQGVEDVEAVKAVEMARFSSRIS